MCPIRIGQLKYLSNKTSAIKRFVPSIKADEFVKRLEPDNVIGTVKKTLKVGDILRGIKPKNLINEGIEAKVYSFGDEYVVRVPNKINLRNVKTEIFEKVKSDLNGRNFGQPIAETKSGVSLSKKVKGKPLYSSLPKPWKSYLPGTDDFYNIGRAEARASLVQLREIAKLEQKTLSEFVDDVAFLQKKGYEVDFRNPNNFLLDKGAQKINILDIKKGNSSKITHLDLLKPLVNYMHLNSAYKNLDSSERREVVRIIKELSNKIGKCCDGNGIPRTKYDQQTTFPHELVAIIKHSDNIDFSISNLIAAVFSIMY